MKRKKNRKKSLSYLHAFQSCCRRLGAEFFSFCFSFVIFFFFPPSISCSCHIVIIDTSSEESDGYLSENAADVTKQFKLRGKRVEVKNNVTKKFVLGSVQIRTPKRRRIVRGQNSGSQTAGAGDNANAVDANAMVRVISQYIHIDDFQVQ